MSDGATLTVTKKDELFARLRALRPAASIELVTATLKSAQEIAQAARALAPVDRGDLRDSIVAEPIEGRPAARVIVNEWTGRLVELGTKRHPQGGMFKGTEHPGTTAQPFLYPAYRLLKKRSQARIGRALAKAARSVAEK